MNGTDFHYLEQGAGVPIILVHGSLGDYRSWRQQIGSLSEHYRVIAYSRRYHYPGTWSGSQSDYSVARQGDDLAGLIEALQLERTHIVASSFGGFVSLFCTLNHSDVVRSLVLGEPPAFPILKSTPNGISYWNDFDRRAWTPARRAFEQGKDEEGVRYFMDGVLGPGSFDKLPRPAKVMLMDNVPAMKAELASPDYLSDFNCEAARTIQTPTLLLDGELSPPMFHRITDELERCLHNAERITIPAASHAIHNQNAKIYNRVVLDFLKKH